MALLTAGGSGPLNRKTMNALYLNTSGAPKFCIGAPKFFQ